MATVFWDAEGVILVDIMPCVQTINSDLYIQTLKTLQKHFSRVQPYKNVAEILLQCNAQPYTSLKIKEATLKFGWTVLPHPPDLAPSDFHLFGALKNAICGRRFGNDDKVTEDVKWLQVQNSNWYNKGTDVLVSRWCKAVEVDGDHVEKSSYPMSMSKELETTNSKKIVMQNFLSNLHKFLLY
jgi:histone-lysine N-methyltransferase SETMAR